MRSQRTYGRAPGCGGTLLLFLAALAGRRPLPRVVRKAAMCNPGAQQDARQRLGSLNGCAAMPNGSLLLRADSDAARADLQHLRSLRRPRAGRRRRATVAAPRTDHPAGGFTRAPRKRPRDEESAASTPAKRARNETDAPAGDAKVVTPDKELAAAELAAAEQALLARDAVAAPDAPPKPNGGAVDRTVAPVPVKEEELAPAPAPAPAPASPSSGKASSSTWVASCGDSRLNTAAGWSQPIRCAVHGVCAMANHALEDYEAAVAVRLSVSARV